MTGHRQMLSFLQQSGKTLFCLLLQQHRSPLVRCSNRTLEYWVLAADQLAQTPTTMLLAFKKP